MRHSQNWFLQTEDIFPLIYLDEIFKQLNSTSLKILQWLQCNEIFLISKIWDESIILIIMKYTSLTYKIIHVFFC